MRVLVGECGWSSMPATQVSNKAIAPDGGGYCDDVWFGLG